MRVSTSDITGKRKGSGSNDIFEKCRNFTRPADLQAAGLYMYFEVFTDREGCGPGEVRIGKRKVLMFGSNDYLDLITHPKVKEAAVQALRKYGSGCSGSRLLNGTLDLHVKLEAELRSPARTVRFRHNDLEHLERCLENCPEEEKILIVSEGVFSMEGDVADLRGIVRLAKPYGARVYV